MNESEKFIVLRKDLEPKEETTITMTLRLEKELQQKYDELSQKSGRSRNELMNLALKFAIEHLQFVDNPE